PSSGSTTMEITNRATANGLPDSNNDTIGGIQMPDQFLALLDSRADEIRALLPKYLTSERFFVLARQVEKNPTLRACTPQSLFDCVLQAAQCGLEIGTVDQHAFIIP